MRNVSNYGAGWVIVPWSPPRPDAPEPEHLEVVIDDQGSTMRVVAEVPDEDRLQGVEVTDPDGITYRCLVETPERGGPYLTRLDVVPARKSQRVNRRFLANVDTDLLARMAADFLARFTDRGPARVVFTPQTAPRAGRGNTPDLQQLADRYNEPGMTPGKLREELADEYGVSAATVGRWLTRARERGYLEEATTGRPPKLPGDGPHQTPDDGSSSGLRK